MTDSSTSSSSAPASAASSTRSSGFVCSATCSGTRSIRRRWLSPSSCSASAPAATSWGHGPIAATRNGRIRCCAPMPPSSCAIAALGLAVSVLLPHLEQLSALVSSYSTRRAGLVRAVHGIVPGARGHRRGPARTDHDADGRDLDAAHPPSRSPVISPSGALAHRGSLRREHAGAALGCLSTDLVLVPAYGLRNTQFIAVAFNVVAGVGALYLAARAGPAERNAGAYGGSDGRRSRLPACARLRRACRSAEREGRQPARSKLLLRNREPGSRITNPIAWSPWPLPCRGSPRWAWRSSGSATSASSLASSAPCSRCCWASSSWASRAGSFAGGFVHRRTTQPASG